MKMKSKEERITQSIAHALLSICSLLALIPFWLLISSSFTEEKTAIRTGYKFIPKVFSAAAYEYILGEWSQIGRAYGVTILVTLIGTVMGILVVTMFAYGLSRKDVAGVKVVFLLVLVTMLFNGGIVPSYYMYSNVLHIKNTIWALILPNLLMNGFTVILVRSYMESNIPNELIEAAEMDGCSQFGIFFKIVFPLSTPIVATVGLLTGVGYWNDWNNGLYYITNEKLYSIQQLLNKMNENISFLSSKATNLTNVSLEDIPSTTVRMAIAVVAILPIICIYPFFQKYFAKGITMGAVKG